MCYRELWILIIFRNNRHFKIKLTFAIVEKKNTFGAIFQTLILSGLIWICFAIARLVLSHPNDEPGYFVPESAQSVISISGDSLVSQSFYSLLFNRSDEEQIALISNLKNRMKSSDSNQKWNLGIDYANDVHVFSDFYQNKKLTGFIFRLSDNDLWDKNGEDAFKGNVVSQRRGNTSIVLESNELSYGDLKSYFKLNCLSKQKPTKNKHLIAYQYRSKTEGDLQNLEANFWMEPHHFAGQFVAKINAKTKIGRQTFKLEKGEFNIQSNYVPTVLSDTLNYFAQKFGTKLPRIQSISLNYNGLEIASTKNGILVLPSLESIIGFETNFSVSDFIQNLLNSNPAMLKSGENSIVIGNKNYYFRQLDAKTIYFGSSKSPKISKTTSNEVISVLGNPNVLRNITGNRFMTGIIKLNDNYKKFESIVKRIDHIDIQLKKKSATELRGTNKMTFSENRKAMDELVKMVLGMI